MLCKWLLHCIVQVIMTKKNTSTHVQYQHSFPPSIFSARLVECTQAEHRDVEVQVCESSAELVLGTQYLTWYQPLWLMPVKTRYSQNHPVTACKLVPLLIWGPVQHQLTLGGTV